VKRGLIFDFDGTLVDTMPLHYEAYRRTFTEVGIDLTPQQFYSAIGGKAQRRSPHGWLRSRRQSLPVHQRI
jgi:beta-phosphoglucomutase-like phosphatase (HAD superfamily)